MQIRFFPSPPPPRIPPSLFCLPLWLPFCFISGSKKKSEDEVPKWSVSPPHHPPPLASFLPFSNQNKQKINTRALPLRPPSPLFPPPPIPLGQASQKIAGHTQTPTPPSSFILPPQPTPPFASPCSPSPPQNRTEKKQMLFTVSLPRCFDPFRSTFMAHLPPPPLPNEA